MIVAKHRRPRFGAGIWVGRGKQEQQQQQQTKKKTNPDRFMSRLSLENSAEDHAEVASCLVHVEAVAAKIFSRGFRLLSARPARRCGMSAIVVPLPIFEHINRDLPCTHLAPIEPLVTVDAVNATAAPKST
jgi:hypothetical protein